MHEHRIVDTSEDPQRAGDERLIARVDGKTGIEIAIEPVDILGLAERRGEEGVMRRIAAIRVASMIRRVTEVDGACRLSTSTSPISVSSGTKPGTPSTGPEGR